MLSRLPLLTALLFLSSVCLAQSAPITIDGRFDDWIPGLTTFTDVPETVSGIDILEVQVTNDADFLYIKVTLDTEIDLNDNLIPHNLSLNLDTDQDPATGFSMQTGFGSELGIQMDDRFAYYNVSPSSTVDLEDFQFRPGPTVSGFEFEMAIGRNAIPDGVNPLFPNPSFNILFRETSGGDDCPDEGTTLSYTFDETPVLESDPIALAKTLPDDLRVVAYNMLQSGLVDASRQDEFERIIKALDPDVIGFSEAYAMNETQAKSQLDSWIPLGTADGWHTTIHEDLITCSRFPFLTEWTNLDSQFPVLIDLPPTYTTDLLFVNAHLNCCAADGTRQNQVDAFAEFMLDAKSPGGLIDLAPYTPMVYGGDLNLVGYARQLETLVTGDIEDNATYGPDGPLDWDGTDLTDQICLHTHQRMSYTWRDDGSSYPPGRLDFLIYTDAALDLQKAYTLRTEILPASELSAHGLNAFDTSTASDHFPLICDFQVAQFVDTDSDGIPDDSDNCPNTANADQADWNNDGSGDVCSDSDGDLLSDADEINLHGTDPGHPDSDLDGLSDGDEVNTHGTNPLMQDTDLDGLTDGLEAFDPDYSPLLSDTNTNGCPDADEYHYLCGESPCGDCIQDLDGNGTIGTGDLLELLASFGNLCP